MCKVCETITPNNLYALGANFQNNKVYTMLLFMRLSNKANLKIVAIVACVFEGEK